MPDSETCTQDIYRLIKTYAVFAHSEGLSHHSISAVVAATTYLADFLFEIGASTDVRDISHLELRTFTIYLREKRRFNRHPNVPTQPTPLSGNTVSTYVRSIRSFFSWLFAEDIIGLDPFARFRVPKPPKRVVATFSETQVTQLLRAVDPATPKGSRD